MKHIVWHRVVHEVAIAPWAASLILITLGEFHRAVFLLALAVGYFALYLESKPNS